MKQILKNIFVYLSLCIFVVAQSGFILINHHCTENNTNLYSFHKQDIHCSHEADGSSGGRVDCCSANKRAHNYSLNSGKCCVEILSYEKLEVDTSSLFEKPEVKPFFIWLSSAWTDMFSLDLFVYSSHHYSFEKDCAKIPLAKQVFLLCCTFLL